MIQKITYICEYCKKEYSMPLLASQCECECKGKQWNKEDFEKHIQPLFNVGDIVTDIEDISMLQHGIVQTRFVDYAHKKDRCMWIYNVYFDGYEDYVSCPEKYLRLAMKAEDYKRKVQDIEDALNLNGKPYSISLDKDALGINLFIPLED
jgi:hypothetical protein